MQTLVIDIDNHLLYSEYNEMTKEYKMISQDGDEIFLVNQKYYEGYTIILYTGRGWGQYEVTKRDLKKANIKYHELVMGKPVGVYIDKECLRSLSEL